MGHEPIIPLYAFSHIRSVRKSLKWKAGKHNIIGFSRQVRADSTGGMGWEYPFLIN
jgi:hypothetical protein